jgi:hypothetical protein
VAIAAGHEDDLRGAHSSTVARPAPPY